MVAGWTNAQMLMGIQLKSGVYHLPPMCHVSIAVKIMFSALGCLKLDFLNILGGFITLRKATITFVMSVRLSTRKEQLGSHLTDFHEI